MRLFLGTFATIDYYGLLKERFSFVQGKWVERHNIHLTYLFLGEHPTPYPIIEKLEGLQYEKKEIPLISLGFFGHPPRVLYAKAEDVALDALHQEIVTRLGITPDKPFLPHVTLCRIKKVPNFSRFIETLRTYRHQRIGKLANELALIESVLTPKGPKYRVIRTF